ncbi:proprotein convertase P-domain-containing protein [uncultured Flavobacterium sp.]|uniref:proprotein convertase P-domain-containing protein n=1 Tax=uncultured Flavobacterium sp. TaxID=165435 RepID=UPI002593DAE1|nr:proprotein convertase P-domain-containing protein [uncultured Flavobacterium sp.]
MNKIICILLLFYINSNTFAQCNWYNNNIACTSNAPTILGQSITCTPPDNNAGRRNFVVNNMISGNIYRISNCGSGLDTQLTIRNAVGDVVGFNDDNGPDCSVFAGPASLDFVCPSDGQFRIQLNRYDCQNNGQIDNGTITVTLISNSATICSNSSATLTPSGSGVNWYSGSCNGVLIGAGTSVSVNPTVSTTYYATSSSWSTCMTTTINVNQAPANVNAGNDVSICNGGSTQLSGSVSSVVPCTNTSTLSNTTNYSVPDNNPIGGSSIINVSSSCGTAAEIVSVKVNINHLWVEDLDISLIAPNGSTINLSSDNGGSGESYINTVFTTTGLMPITLGTAPFTGNYIPEEPFSNLTGSAVGNWTLKVVDDEYLFGGTIINWSITVKTSQNTTANYSWLPTTGLSNPNIANPVASPTTTTTYTMTATTNGCSASDSVVVTVHPILNSGSHNTTPLTKCVGFNPSILTFITNPTGGDGNYSYQWQLNTVDITNATSSSYDPNAIMNPGVYAFRCKVTDGCGSIVYTNPKVITIVADPNQPICLKFPNIASVCVGTSLTLQNCMYGTESGVLCPLEFSYSIDAGVSWSAVSTLVPNFSATGTTNLIRVRVSNCGSCNASLWNVYSWNVYSIPTTTTINHN